MLGNFNYSNPTKLYFGDDAISFNRIFDWCRYCWNNDLKSSVYREIEFIIDKMIAGDYGFEGKIYLFISYENKKLDIRYIFSKSQDCKKYLNKKDIMNSNLLEIKYIGNGASIEYMCDI